MKIIFFVCLLITVNDINGSAFSFTSAFGTLHDPKLPSKCYGNDLSESLKSGVNDIVIVQQSDDSFKSTPFQARVGKLSNWKTLFKSREGKQAKLYVNNIRALGDVNLLLSDSGAVFIHRPRSMASCSFTSEEMQNMALDRESNDGLVVVEDLDIELKFKIYVFNQRDRLVVTDIDGTITTSDVGGFLGGSIGVGVEQPRVVEFFNKVNYNGYKVLYLTARPMAFDGLTREYLFETLQDVDGNPPDFIRYSLPIGPLFMSPISAEKAISANAEVMKLSTLTSIIDLFDSKEESINGAYGNKNSDTESYLKSGIQGENVYLVNNQGKIVNVATGNITSYRLQSKMVNEYYPKL